MFYVNGFNGLKLPYVISYAVHGNKCRHNRCFCVSGSKHRT